MPVRDLLYLNEGTDESGRPTFREVGRAAGIERERVGHGLGASFTDYDLDGRLDLYVANDADPNQLYRNVPRPVRSGSASRSWHRAAAVDDPNAGMGIAAADFSLDGRADLFVTNSRDQLHAAYRSRALRRGPPFADVRPDSRPCSAPTPRRGARRGPTSTSTATSTSSWRTARFPS